MSDQQRAPVKTVPNGVLYSDGSIRLDRVRLSYPHLLEPWASIGRDGKKGKPAYSGTFLMPKATHREAKDLCKRRIDELLAEKKWQLGADKLFLRDGDLSGKAENARMFTVSAREAETHPPRLRTPSKQRVVRGQMVMIGGQERPAERVFYGGCWVNVLINPWAQNNEFGKRINANLLAVMFVRDDTPFGEGQLSDDDVDDRFEALEEDDSGFDDVDTRAMADTGL